MPGSRGVSRLPPPGPNSVQHCCCLGLSCFMLGPSTPIRPRHIFCYFECYLLHFVISSAQERAPIHPTGRKQNELSHILDKVYCPIAFEIVSNDVTSWLQLQNTAVCSSVHFKTQCFKWLLRVMSSQLLARSKFNYLYTIVTISEPKSGTSKLESAQMADCLQV